MIQNNSTQKSKTNKNMTVQFSHLNDNNKTQFLQFLLKNNITFQKTNAKGKDDYVAKVTIAKPGKQNKQNKQNQHTSHKNAKKTSVTNKSQSKSKPTLLKNQLTSISSNLDKSIKMLTPKKQNNVSVCEEKKINSIIQKKVSENKSMIDIQGQNSKKNQKVMKNNSSLKVGTSNKNCQLKTVKTTEFISHDECQSAKKINKEKSDKTIKNMVLKKQDSKLNKNEKTFREQQFSKSRSLTKGNIQHHSNTKNIVEKSPIIINKSQRFDKKVPVEKQKIIQVNNQIKKKTSQQKQINELVNKYLKLFDLKLLGQRPIKWPFSQLMKTIQQLYNQLFLKNTQTLVQKGYSQKQNPVQCGNNFTKFIRQFFVNKYKNEKLVTSNLINMLYSLSFYLQNEKKILLSKNYVKQIKANLIMTASGIFMQIFQDFLCQIYSFEDLLFYLFIRSIIINQANIFHSTKMKLQKQSKQNQNVLQKQIVLNFKDIMRILKLILGQDMDLVQQYKLMILSHINSSTKLQKNQKETITQGERQLKISGPEFMALLVEDYRSKRLLMQDSLASFKQIKTLNNNKSLQNYSLASQNTFQQLMHANEKKKSNIIGNRSQKAINFTNLNQNAEYETDQLTFGEQTQENMEKFLSNQRSFNAYFSFWENSQESRQAEDLQPDSLQSIIYQKMKKKVKQFFNILIQNRSQYNSLQPKNKNIWNQNSQQPQKLGQPRNMQTIFIIELLMKKSISLLSCIVDMNKIKWFQELKVDDPTQEDIDKVQQLQLSYRKLKSDPDAQGIGKLCKNILTVPQLTFALEKLLGL